MWTHRPHERPSTVRTARTESYVGWPAACSSVPARDEDKRRPVLRWGLEEHLRLRVMVIDDDEVTLTMVEEHLEAAGHQVRVRSEAIGTTNAIREFAPDVVLLDLSMPSIDGDRLSRLFASAGLRTQLVLFSGRDPEELAMRAMSMGAVGFVHKEDAGQLSMRLERIVAPRFSRVRRAE